MTASTVIGDVPTRGQFDHVGQFYRDAGQYLDGIASFLAEPIAAGDPVLIAVPGANLGLLRERLPDLEGRAHFADMTVAGCNPGRIIPSVLFAFADAYPERRVWIVGEPIWPGRTAMEYPACAAHEALINAAFAGRDAAILCPYDVAGLDRTALDDAGRTHPTLLDGQGRRDSPTYTDPLATAASFNRPLPPMPGHAVGITFDGEFALVEVRRFVVRYASAAGLPAERVGDLTVAVNELATNTIEHASGQGAISVWTEPGRFVCQIDDQGHLADPLAGRIPPPPDAVGGRGLLLTNHLCDLVRIHTRPWGTSIRLHLRTDPDQTPPE